MQKTESKPLNCRATYQGDAALAGLLAKHGVSMTLPELRNVLAGVIGAVHNLGRDEWLGLVVEKPSPALAAQLRALAHEMWIAARDGLDIQPAPPTRLQMLRTELARRGLTGFVVPLADEHQAEFMAPRARRLQWLSGFAGSAGIAVVLANKAAIFVDGRYTLQVQEQVHPRLFTPKHITEQPPTDWITSELRSGDRLGYDPWLHTPDGVAKLEAACVKAGARLEPVANNPIDAVWKEQPAPPLAPAFVHEIRFAGRAAVDKRKDVAQVLKKHNADAVVLTALDSVAWLLNMRGQDVANTPVAQACVLVHRSGGVELFIDPRKVDAKLRRAFGNEVSVAPIAAFGAALDRLGAAKRRALADPALTPAWVFQRLAQAGADVVRAEDPCVLPKALKNAAELDGARAAHRRDGAALVRFLAWLAETAPTNGLTEIDAADRLMSFRAANDFFRGTSFDTIAGAGPNGAIVHYRASPRSNRKIAAGTVLLLDSGGQYLDGTTDVTRTIFIAGAQRKSAPREAQDRFTRVLKGHIALATARFPVGTSGAQLDTLARFALWQVGLDYDHGTGHGVGSYLNVHEGPAMISKLGAAVPLRPGMVLSNEPGYYKTGAYGIRIENLVVVRGAAKPAGAERELLEFETLTLCPIDLALVETKLMTAAEIAWLDAYHARVRRELAPLLDKKNASWLKDATRRIGQD